MKNLILTFLGLLILSLGSCKKEEITPVIHPDNIERQSDNAKRKMLSDHSGDNKSANDKSGLGLGLGNSDVIPDSLRNITDPNRDEDEDRKIKNRR